MKKLLFIMLLFVGIINTSQEPNFKIPVKTLNESTINVSDFLQMTGLTTASFIAALFCDRVRSSHDFQASLIKSCKEGLTFIYGDLLPFIVGGGLILASFDRLSLSRAAVYALFGSSILGVKCLTSLIPTVIPGNPSLTNISLGESRG